MRLLFLFCFFISISAFSQESKHIIGHNYEGFSFPKEFHIHGFPPEENRYSLDESQIKEVESILEYNIHKFNRLYMATPHFPRRIEYDLKNYYRQYYSYTKDNDIIVRVFLIKKDPWNNEEMLKELSSDIQTSLGGSISNPSFEINLTTKEIKQIQKKWLLEL